MIRILGCIALLMCVMATAAAPSTTAHPTTVTLTPSYGKAGAALAIYLQS